MKRNTLTEIEVDYLSSQKQENIHYPETEDYNVSIIVVRTQQIYEKAEFITAEWSERDKKEVNVSKED